MDSERGGALRVVGEGSSRRKTPPGVRSTEGSSWRGWMV